jgi:hypothetical protein
MSDRVNTDVLNRYIDRVRQAARSRSKQLTLQIEDAQDIANALAQLLLVENQLQSDLIKLQNASSVIEVAIGGGSFK